MVSHNSYSRIDNFFVFFLDVPVPTSLGNLLWSDYAPVYLALDHLPKSHRVFSWSLNDNLLKDYSCVADIKFAIQNFVLDHRSDDTNPLTQWEALKFVIQSR